ncbi:MAG: hypothetical protein GQ564_07730 [Bacteroidales bacterium]|nr:hypothetical protein [Bacteroidales bacterium]
MGDNFDTIIYIIITIVAFAISALGKKRKKDRNNNQSVSTESPSKPKARPFLSNLEQLLKEEMGIPDQKIQNEYGVNSINEDYEQEFENLEEMIENPTKETINTKDKIPYSIEYEDTNEIFSDSIQDSDLTKQEEEPIIKDFNLRDAVIYSEIINRKEY